VDIGLNVQLQLQTFVDGKQGDKKVAPKTTSFLKTNQKTTQNVKKQNSDNYSSH